VTGSAEPLPLFTARSNQAGLGFEWSLQFLLEADGTRSTQDARRPGHQTRRRFAESLNDAVCAMERQSRRRLAKASRRRRASRANQNRAKVSFLPCFEKNTEFKAQCPNGVPGAGQITELASVSLGERRSDARHEPAFPALSLARKLCICAAQRASTRDDALEHGASSDETNIQVYSRHPTVPLVCLHRGDAAIAACQARGHLHVAVAYGAQPGRTKKREAFACAHPCECPKCANRVHVFRKTENSGDYPASHRVTFLCTSRRRCHRGQPSARA
jgi:hypothetical protein